MRRTYGSIREEERRRIRTNNKIENILQGKGIMRFIKSQQLAWLELVGEERIPKMLIHTKMKGRRICGKARKRWIQDV